MPGYFMLSNLILAGVTGIPISLLILPVNKLGFGKFELGFYYVCALSTLPLTLTQGKES